MAGLWTKACKRPVPVIRNIKAYLPSTRGFMGRAAERLWPEPAAFPALFFCFFCGTSFLLHVDLHRQEKEKYGGDSGADERPRVLSCLSIVVDGVFSTQNGLKSGCGGGINRPSHPSPTRGATRGGQLQRLWPELAAFPLPFSHFSNRFLSPPFFVKSVQTL